MTCYFSCPFLRLRAVLVAKAMFFFSFLDWLCVNFEHFWTVRKRRAVLCWAPPPPIPRYGVIYSSPIGLNKCLMPLLWTYYLKNRSSRVVQVPYNMQSFYSDYNSCKFKLTWPIEYLTLRIKTVDINLNPTGCKEFEAWISGFNCTYSFFNKSLLMFC